ncbi:MULTISPECIES: hypothetical protein [Halorussus]|uniref:hypothetical protein n=1 Tax=Halorussus TaxID=1070314 RepID=UPI0020A1C72E|nr:hypothetical protein [Halorussus vallis]USZ74428.1 hypothetical protein NGM07_13345 [Halorussus vallis]
MSTSKTAKEHSEEAEVDLLSQRTVPNKTYWSKIAAGSFDRLSVFLVLSAFLVPIILAALWGTIGNHLPFLKAGPYRGNLIAFSIASLSAVFTLLSIREKKRDREASVGPTLFVAKRGDEYGIVNLGAGPAHELTVQVADEHVDDWEHHSSVETDKILRVGDDFLSLDTEDEPREVRMVYRTNLGNKERPIIREITAE